MSAVEFVTPSVHNAPIDVSGLVEKASRPPKPATTSGE